MKVLVIPDVHLKPWMFTDAENIMKEEKLNTAVCLGDLVDDFECNNDEALYRETLDKAAAFATAYPNSLWCFGNHDMAYLWNVWVTGTAFADNVREAAVHGIKELYYSISAGHLAYVHRIDNVLFSHAGISRMFVREHFPVNDYEKPAKIIPGINDMRLEDLWNDDSPIWLRPQRFYCHHAMNMYKPRTFLQVVGHSPMKEITQEKNLITCDVFSLYRDRTPYGTQEFCLLDTENWKWRGILAEHAIK